MFRALRYIAVSVMLELIAGCRPQAMSVVHQDFDPVLSPPSRIFMCRSPRPSPADSAAFVIRFADGANLASGRQTVIAYDSAGTPLYMAIRAPDSLSANMRVQVIAIRFRPDRRGVWTIMEADSTGRLSSHARNGEPLHKPPSGADLLTETEIAQSSRFAEWGWQHRCTTPQ
jgi:hypothetical protein